MYAFTDHFDISSYWHRDVGCKFRFIFSIRLLTTNIDKILMSLVGDVVINTYV